jgi:hypothetical protein
MQVKNPSFQGRMMGVRKSICQHGLNDPKHAQQLQGTAVVTIRDSESSDSPLGNLLGCLDVSRHA